MTISLPAIFRRPTAALQRLRPADGLKRKWRLSQAVLMLGDDGYRVAVLDRQRRLKTRFAQAGNDGRTAIVEWLRIHKIQRLRIVCDQTGQSYAREEVPNASRRDQALILKRRLDTRFGKGALTTWLAIDDFRAPIATGVDEAVTSKPYLLAVLAGESDIQPWLDELADARIEVTSIGLLPLEWAAALPAVLGLSGEELTGAVWRVVVTRHRTGGVRHVVLRGDQLVLTRLTPDAAMPAAIDPTVGENGSDQAVPNGVITDQWNRHLLSEIEASISYIKRFGYTADQQLFVSLIGGETLTRVTDESNRASGRHWQSYHAKEAADRLKIVLPTEDNAAATDWSDVLVAAAIVTMPVCRPLSSPTWLRMQRRRCWEIMTRAAIVSMIAGLVGWSGWLGWELYGSLALKKQLNAELAGLQQVHVQTRERAAGLPQDLNNRRSFLRAFEQHYALEQGLSGHYQAIMRTLGPELRLAQLSWYLKAQNDGGPIAEIDLRFDLRRADDVKEARGLIDAFLSRLGNSLPEGQVAISELEVPLADTMPTSGSWSADQPADRETPILAGYVALLVKGEN